MKTTKPCKICGKEMPKGLNSVCSMKCKKEQDKQKKAKIKEQKKMSVSSLGKVADKIMSEYIRKRDALLTTGGFSQIVCITCGELKDYSQFDCGHFVTRSNKSTRWEEKNCNAQCKVCNNWGGGRQYEHGKAIDRKYGEGIADVLIKLGNEPQKVTSGWLLFIIANYKEKLEKLNNN